MDTVDEFKNAYAELESIIKKYEDKNNDDLIENSSIITKMKECEFITACRRMRNILVHQKSKYKGKTIDFFEPNEEVILKLKKIIENIEHPKMVTDFFIPINCVSYKKMSDLIFPVMKEMSEKVYTHIPILDDEKKLLGVFSENTIFSYLLDEEIIEISKEMTFEELKSYLDINNHISEIFKFTKRNTNIFELKKIFEQELNERNRIGMVFITQNGTPNEPILGIITPWDIAGLNDVE